MSRFSQWFSKVRTFIFGVTTITVVLVYLDNNLQLNGFLLIPGIIFEVVLIICLFIRNRIKRSKETEYSDKEGTSYTVEQLCIDLEDGCEIEFTYDYTRYLFIPENGRYFFKRIVSIDPYEYEILAEAEDALACIGASAVDGKKIIGLWPDVEDITVY